jgi:hypothetical protein
VGKRIIVTLFFVALLNGEDIAKPDKPNQTVTDQITLLKTQIAVMQAKLDFVSAQMRQCQDLYQAALNSALAPASNLYNSKFQDMNKLRTDASKKCESGRLADDFSCDPVKKVEVGK